MWGRLNHNQSTRQKLNEIRLQKTAGARIPLPFPAEVNNELRWNNVGRRRGTLGTKRVAAEEEELWNRTVEPEKEKGEFWGSIQRYDIDKKKAYKISTTRYCIKDLDYEVIIEKDVNSSEVFKCRVAYLAVR